MIFLKCFLDHIEILQLVGIDDFNPFCAFDFSHGCNFLHRCPRLLVFTEAVLQFSHKTCDDGLFDLHGLSFYVWLLEFLFSSSTSFLSFSAEIFRWRRANSSALFGFLCAMASIMAK